MCGIAGSDQPFALPLWLRRQEFGGAPRSRGVSARPGPGDPRLGPGQRRARRGGRPSQRMEVLAMAQPNPTQTRGDDAIILRRELKQLLPSDIALDREELREL